MKLRESLEDDPTINLTPMIDVVFTLLVFFMLATTFAERERMLDIDLPATSSVEAPAKGMVINVPRDGNILIDGRSLQGVELARTLSDASRRDPNTAVTVRGDRDGAYERIVFVLDECSRAGLSNLSLSTLDK
jgi:biopolymer transport protein ExbD